MTITKKYPRTKHLPWSPGRTEDDKVLRSTSHFDGKEVVAMVKMDGENTSCYRDHIHARSMDGIHHPSRDWVKNHWSMYRSVIPEYWRICGENLFASHSIEYTDLKSYFMAFSIWDDRNVRIHFDQFIEWLELINTECDLQGQFRLIHPEILYRGVWDEQVIRNLEIGDHEGYVISLVNEFHYDDFGNSMAKFVRANHVQTENHWMQSEIVPNRLG